MPDDLEDYDIKPTSSEEPEDGVRPYVPEEKRGLLFPATLATWFGSPPLIPTSTA